jgi:hypothetical protein
MKAIIIIGLIGLALGCQFVNNSQVPTYIGPNQVNVDKDTARQYGVTDSTGILIPRSDTLLFILFEELNRRRLTISYDGDEVLYDGEALIPEDQRASFLFTRKKHTASRVYIRVDSLSGWVDYDDNCDKMFIYIGNDSLINVRYRNLPIYIM